ncbi:phosphopantetheine-binding protein [Parabacteroides sp. APC149_11_2_Y6]
MKTFIEQIAELLEEDSVNMTDELKSFESWDSLTILSIIAMADELYGVTINTSEIISAKTVKGLNELIESKRAEK